ncbi:MAG: sensor histidine kinase, partial [Bacteroidota bacterium]
KNFVSSIHSSSLNTFRLLQELLQWAKLQQGKMEFNPMLITLNEICESCFNLLNLAAQQKQIKLGYTIPDNMVVYADKPKIESMIRNIMSNSIKFTPENGKVSLVAEYEGDKVKISISDTGIGMNEEKVASLFQLSNVKSEHGTNGEEGTGLGLIITHEFARMHKTKLHVVSSLGQGTTTSFLLPSHP